MGVVTRLDGPRARLAVGAPVALAVVVTVLVLAQGGGYFVTDWYPGGLVLLGLLAVTLVALRSETQPSRIVLVAVGLLTMYALWSFLSISWSDQQGLAWDG